MKIIISPSKEMDFKNKVKGKAVFRQNTLKILRELRSRKKEDLKKLLKISDKLLDEVYDYYQNFEGKDLFYALDMYSGLAFRQMEIDPQDQFASQHLVILSALYGPLEPGDLVKPYRLDFNTGLKIEGQALKSLWKGPYNDYFFKGEMILNLASDEFSSLLDRDSYDWVDFDFYERDADKEKRHSTISKKARGSMCDYIIRNRLTKLDDIRLFKENGYIYDEDKSREGLLVFYREVRL